MTKKTAKEEFEKRIEVLGEKTFGDELIGFVDRKMKEKKE